MWHVIPCNLVTNTFEFLRSRLHARHFLLAVLLSLSAIVIFYNLGANSFRNSDEVFYALTARDMLRTGDWLTPRVEGLLAFSKPPLVAWLTSLSILIFGFSEFSARLPAAVFGFLTIVLTYKFGELLFGRRAAFLASFALLTSTYFIYFHSCRTGEYDSALTFFLLLGTYAVFRSRERMFWFYLVFVAMGLIFMIKPPLALIPLLVLLTFHLGFGRSGGFSIGNWLLGFTIVAVISLPWHIVEVVVNRRSFVDLYVLDQIIGRRLAPGMSTGFAPLYYIKTIAHGFFPWSVFLPLSLIYALVRPGKGSQREQCVLLLLFVLIVLLLVNVIPLKYAWYVNPLYPVLAILVSAFLIAVFESTSGVAFFCMSTATGVCLILFLSPNLPFNPFVASDLGNPTTFRLGGLAWLRYPGGDLFSVVVVFSSWLCLSLILYLTFRRDRVWGGVSRNVLVCSLASYVFAVALLQVLMPLRYSDFRSWSARMGRDLWSVAEHGSSVVFYGNNMPLLKDYVYFYDFKNLRMDPIVHAGLDRRFLLSLLSSERKIACLMERQHYYDIRHDSAFSAWAQPLREWEDWVCLGNSTGRRVDGRDAAAEAGYLRRLQTGPSASRGQGAGGLGRIGDGKAVGALTGLLNDDDSDVVCAAARALGDIRDSSAADALAQALKRYNGSDPAYGTISLALAYLRDCRSVPYLVSYYERNPLYKPVRPDPGNPPEYRDYNRIWNSYLLLDIDPAVGRNVIARDIIEYFARLRSSGIVPSIYNVRNSDLFRVGNTFALDVISTLLDERDASVRMMALYLLTQPSGIATRMAEVEVQRAKSMLRRAANDDDSDEVRKLAGQISAAYHEGSWIAW